MRVKSSSYTAFLGPHQIRVSEKDPSEDGKMNDK